MSAKPFRTTLRVGDRVRHLTGGPVWIVALLDAGSAVADEVLCDRFDRKAGEHRIVKMPVSSLRRTWRCRFFRD